MITLFLVASLLFGLIIGSFINCLVWRLHKEESINGRSYCPECRKTIRWYDNLPIISFIILGGRCRNCRKSISWQYPLVEFLTGILFLIFAYKISINFGSPELWLIKPWLMLIRDWFLVSIFTIIFIMDFRWYVILDRVSLPAIIVSLIINLALGFSWQSLLISATIGASFFLIQFIVSRGRWIGGGDVRLGLLLGIALGWPYIVAVIFLAYGLGAIIGLGLLASNKKKRDSMVPLGTFLTFAALIILLFGSEIINWYLNLINWR